MKRLNVIEFLFLLFLYACTARRVGTEWDTMQSNDSVFKDGRTVFKIHCQRCHPNGEAGVGPPINAFKLPGFALRARIRSRAFLLWLGRMPAFDKKEISDDQLDHLVKFIHEMEKGKGRTAEGAK